MFDAIHAEAVPMSEAERVAFPEADLLMAVMMPRDASGEIVAGDPIVRVHVGAAFPEIPKTNLVGVGEIGATGNGKGYQLLPRPKQLLQIRHPDASVSYCPNVPGRWVWFKLLVAERSQS